MKAQVNLTPAESKKLIARALARMETVRRASEEGLLVVHPSSSTYFLARELTGESPPDDAWVRGVIVPKAACILSWKPSRPVPGQEARDSRPTPKTFPYSWVIQKGKLTTGRTLEQIMDEMTPNDVYVKGVNALDVHNEAGVLIGNPHGMGSIGYVVSRWKKKGFRIIMPVGCEKLIPGSIRVAARTAVRQSYGYGMGVPCALMPLKGEPVTEIEAVRMLSGAKAVPIAAGGLWGGEGSLVLVITGSDREVDRAVAHVEAAKGARLPEGAVQSCRHCTIKACRFPVGDKPWVMEGVDD